jgi:peptidoglycan hydrolase-like protein with peptidoglycan-binding domain
VLVTLIVADLAIVTARASDAPVPPGQSIQLPPRASPADSPPGIGSEVKPFSLVDLPQLHAGLRPGSRGTTVVILQQHLRRLSDYKGAIHGQLDQQTADAVRRFQSTAKVTGDPTGSVGRSMAVALLAEGDRPQLTFGATGKDVTRLQQALALALERPLPATGTFGSATRQAVRDYQSSRGLPVTGTVATQTWTALQRGR